MTRKRLDELGSLQQAVMDVLWNDGEATVQAVRESLPGKQPAYTTVLSVLQKLEKAGWVTHRTEGRAYVYTALQTREEEGSSALRTFTERVFRGDPLLLFQNLLEDDRLDAGDLEALRAIIDEKRSEANREERGDAD